MIDKLLHGRLSEVQAEALAAAGPEVVRLALLAANARIARLQPGTLTRRPRLRRLPLRRPRLRA